MSNTKSFERWLNRVNDTETPWAESEIIYFRKAIGMAGLKDQAQRNLLVSSFRLMVEKDVQSYHITEAQSLKGRDYLLSQSLKANGTRRKGCRLDQSQLDILQALETHYFVGLWNMGQFSGSAYYLPIYRALDVNGNWFDYIGATYSQVRVLAQGTGTPRLRLVSGGK